MQITSTATAIIVNAARPAIARIISGSNPFCEIPSVVVVAVDVEDVVVVGVGSRTVMTKIAEL